MYYFNFKYVFDFMKLKCCIFTVQFWLSLWMTLKTHILSSFVGLLMRNHLLLGAIDQIRCSDRVHCKLMSAIGWTTCLGCAGRGGRAAAWDAMGGWAGRRIVRTGGKDKIGEMGVSSRPLWSLWITTCQM